MVNTGTYLGSLAASLMALGLTSVFSQEQILEWAWRIPFLLSLLIGGIGIWIRSQMEDTPQFEELQDKGETKKLPIRELLSTSGGSVVKIILLGALITGGYYIASVYAATYLQTTGGHSSRVAFLSTSLALVLGVITLPISGYMADKYGRRPVLFAGSAAAVVSRHPDVHDDGRFWHLAGGCRSVGALHLRFRCQRCFVRDLCRNAESICAVQRSGIG